MVEDQLFVAIPVGLVHNKDFMRKVLVGKVGAAFCVTIRLELDRPNITCGMLGWMEIWEVSLGWDWFSLDAFEDSILLSLNDLPSTMRFRIVCCLSFRRDISLASCFSKPDLKSNPSEDLKTRKSTQQHYNWDWLTLQNPKRCSLSMRWSNARASEVTKKQQPVVI